MSSNLKRISAFILILVMALGVAVGCGGDDDEASGDTVSADEYVSSVCTAISDMAGVIEGSQGELQEAVSSDPAEGKEQLVGFLDEAAATVASAREDLEAAGVPDVESGEEIAAGIPAAFGDLQAAIEEAAADAEEVSTESPTDFAEQIQNVGTTVQTAGEQIGESLNELASSEELEAAAEDSEACQEIGT